MVGFAVLFPFTHYSLIFCTSTRHLTGLGHGMQPPYTDHWLIFNTMGGDLVEYIIDRCTAAGSDRTARDENYGHVIPAWIQAATSVAVVVL
jgi:hypothetical protein